MADNTISKLQINQTTYDLGGNGSGSSEEPIVEIMTLTAESADEVLGPDNNLYGYFYISRQSPAYFYLPDKRLIICAYSNSGNPSNGQIDMKVIIWDLMRFDTYYYLVIFTLYYIFNLK